MIMRSILLAVFMLFSSGRCAAEDAAPTPDSVATPGTVHAHQDGISIGLANRILFPRAYAPLPVLLAMACDEGTRTGRLRLRLQDGSETLYTWISPEWTLTRAPRTVEQLLPPVPMEEMHGELQASMEWVEDGRTVRFAPLVVTVPGRSERPLCLGLCMSTGIDTRAVVRMASLERFRPTQAADAKSSGADFRTVIVRLSEDDLPTQALAWCAYDAMVIAGDVLARLKDRQLAALERWLRAGGSLLLLTEGPVPDQAFALIARAAQEGGAAPPVRDAHQGVAALGDHPSLLYAGLGRLAVAPLAQALDAGDAWRQLPVHLWNVRSDQAAEMVGNGAWNRALLDQTHSANAQNSYDQYNRTVNFAHHDQAVNGALTNVLMPSQIAIIPFSIVLITFVVFILIIGPGDWLVLGWLRARRFTWIVFPLVAISFTVFMVRMSRHYLGGADHRQHLEIVDFGAEGAVLRDERIELVFTGTSTDLASDIHDGLWADLNRTGQGGSNPYSYQRYRQQQTSEVNSTPTYDGAVPGSYRVTQAVGQWDPRLRRSLSFSAPADMPLKIARDFADPSQVAAAASELVGGDAAGFVGYFQGGQLTNVLGQIESLSGHQQVHQQWQGNQQWIQPLSCHVQTGWFALCSRTSPAGGSTWEDLPVHDPTDKDQWLLITAVHAGDTLWVARRLYRLHHDHPGVH